VGEIFKEVDGSEKKKKLIFLKKKIKLTIKVNPNNLITKKLKLI